MSQPTSRRAHRPIRLGLGAFGLVAIILAVVFAGGPALQRLVTGDNAVEKLDASDAQRAVRFGPRRVGGGSTVGQTIGGIANAAQFVFYDDATMNRELDGIQNTGAGWVRFDFL
jgi:hypothetical protein